MFHFQNLKCPAQDLWKWLLVEGLASHTFLMLQTIFKTSIYNLIIQNTEQLKPPMTSPMPFISRIRSVLIWDYWSRERSRKKKPRIRETLNLSTCVDSSTDNMKSPFLVLFGNYWHFWRFFCNCWALFGTFWHFLSFFCLLFFFFAFLELCITFVVLFGTFFVGGGS